MRAKTIFRNSYLALLESYDLQFLASPEGGTSTHVLKLAAGHVGEWPPVLDAEDARRKRNRVFNAKETFQNLWPSSY